MNGRSPSDSPLFIHRPALQRGHGRLAFRVLTAVAWALYLYLWLPLATLALWWGGTRLGLHELRHYPEYVDYGLFIVVAKAFVIALILLLGWAEYNRRRFKGVDRRRPQPNLDPAETARAMECSPELAQRLRQARRTIASLDEQAALRGLEGTVPLGNGDVGTTAAALPPRHGPPLPAN